MSRVLHGLAAAALAFFSLSAAAVDEDRIILASGGVGKQIYLPAKLAERLGYFKEQGLEVELQSEIADSYAEDQLLAGAVKGVVGFYNRTIDLQARGMQAESVVQFSDVPGEVEMVVATMSGQIKSPADFRGKRLGVTALGSSTQLLTRFLAVSSGVKPGEFTTVPVGAGNKFILAMRQGRIDAGMTTEPTVSRLLKSGTASILLDLRGQENTRQVFGGPYPAACLFMETAWVHRNPLQVQKLVNAFVKTLRYIHDHSAEEIAEHLPPEFFAGDRTAYIKALDAGKGMFLADGRMPDEGPPTVLKAVAAVSPRLVKHVDLSKTYTNEFVDATARAQQAN